MAEAKERFPSAPPGPTPRSYPWDQWTDGRAWKLTIYQDYDKLDPLLAATRAIARRRGLRFRYQKWQRHSGSGLEVASGIWLQFWPVDQSEPAREEADRDW